MSELLVNTIKKADGTGSLTVPAESGTVVTTASPSLGRRNLIINGAMVVNQRNQTVTTSDAFYVDRFKAFYNTSSGTYSIAQDSDAPDNFEYSSKVTITASDDLTGSEFMTLAYYAEGYDVAPLNFGTAAAREFTLSFWVKSSVAGTYGVSFRNHAANRSFVSSYTINSANTWEHKSVTVTADANGSWVKTNGIGLIINWELGNSANYSTSAGSWQSGNYWGLTGGTKLVNTNGATLQLTGVQLEVGSVATPFEHRSYGEELALCQRYFEKWNGVAQYSKAREVDRIRYLVFFYKQSKRVPPTLTITNLQDGDSLASWTDNSVDSFRTQSTAFSDGATPYFTGLTVDAEL